MTRLESLINDYGEPRAARGVKANTSYGESVKLRLFAAWLLRRGVMDMHAVAPEHITGYQAELVTIEHPTKARPKSSHQVTGTISSRRSAASSKGSSARRIVINPPAQIDLARTS